MYIEKWYNQPFSLKEMKRKENDELKQLFSFQKVTIQINNKKQQFLLLALVVIISIDSQSW